MGRNNLRSKCCGAIVSKEGSSGYIGTDRSKIETSLYICANCDKPCDVYDLNKLKSLCQGKKKSQENKRMIQEPVHVDIPYSATIIKADNGFIVEYFVELATEIGEPRMHHKVQIVCESPEFEPDDLVAFEKVIWNLMTYFGVNFSSDRKLEINIYDPERGKNKNSEIFQDT